MSATGDAVVLYRGQRRRAASSRATAPPAGRGAATRRCSRTTTRTRCKRLMVEFDGAGRAVALANFREFVRHGPRERRGTGGGVGADRSGPRRRRVDATTLRDPRTALVRHPQGAVAVWTRRATSSNFNDDIVVSRLSGAAGTRRRSSMSPNRFDDASAATNAAGEILRRGDAHTARRAASTTSRVDRARRSPAPGRAMALVSPQAEPANSTATRSPPAAGRRSTSAGACTAPATAHRGDLDEAAAGRAPSDADADRDADTDGRPPRRRRPRRHGDRDADPSPQPLPAPPTPPTPDPAAAVQRDPGPSAIADFTTLPAASKCVRGRKLTVRFKKPPKGYVVKAVTVKVNARRSRRSRAQAQEAALPAQAAERDVHRHRLDHADQGQGPDGATTVHGV